MKTRAQVVFWTIHSLALQTGAFCFWFFFSFLAYVLMSSTTRAPQEPPKSSSSSSVALYERRYEIPLNFTGKMSQHFFFSSITHGLNKRWPTENCWNDSSLFGEQRKMTKYEGMRWRSWRENSIFYDIMVFLGKC